MIPTLLSGWSQTFNMTTGPGDAWRRQAAAGLADWPEWRGRRRGNTGS